MLFWGVHASLRWVLALLAVAALGFAAGRFYDRDEIERVKVLTVRNAAPVGAGSAQSPEASIQALPQVPGALAEIMRLRGDFAQTTALYVLASSQDRAGVERLLNEAASIRQAKLAMKQAWWAWSWSCRSSSGPGTFSPPNVTSGPERHSGHGQAPCRILRQDTDRLVVVAVHDVPLAGGDGQERQHVAAGEAGDERLLGIDAPLVALVGGGGRGPDRDRRRRRTSRGPGCRSRRRSRASPASSRP